MSVIDRNKLWVILLLMCFTFVAKGQKESAVPTFGPAENGILLRFKPVSGGPKWLNAKTVSGNSVNIGNWYERVSSQTLSELKRKESAAYWYEVFPDRKKERYIVRAKTHKNTLGVSRSYLFFEDLSSHGDWLLDEYEDDFEGAAFGLHDFSVGLLYARQLYAKNRHRLSLEMVPAYRQIRHSFAASHYTTSFDATDPDGIGYERLVTVDHYDEYMLRHCISLQVDFRYDWYFLKWLSLFVAAGVDNLFDLATVSEADFRAKYAGKYGEELFNVVIDENGLYDFGTFPDNHIVTDKGTTFQYSLYGVALAGLQFSIGHSFSLDASFVYNKLFFSNMKTDASDRFCLSESSGKYQSMAYTMKPAARNRLGVNLRLKVNF